MRTALSRSDVYKLHPFRDGRGQIDRKLATVHLNSHWVRRGALYKWDCKRSSRESKQWDELGEKPHVICQGEVAYRSSGRKPEEPNPLYVKDLLERCIAAAILKLFKVSSISIPPTKVILSGPGPHGGDHHAAWICQDSQP